MKYKRIEKPVRSFYKYPILTDYLWTKWKRILMSNDIREILVAQSKWTRGMDISRDVITSVEQIIL